MDKYKQEISEIIQATEIGNLEKIEDILDTIECSGYKRGFKDCEILNGDRDDLVKEGLI